MCTLAPHLLIISLKWICANMSADNTACSIFEISLMCLPKIAKKCNLIQEKKEFPSG